MFNDGANTGYWKYNNEVGSVVQKGVQINPLVSGADGVLILSTGRNMYNQFLPNNVSQGLYRIFSGVSG